MRYSSAIGLVKAGGQTMNGKKIRYTLGVVISSIVMGLIFFYLFRYFKRHMVLRAQQQITQSVDRDIIELQALGFSPDCAAIESLRCRKAELCGMSAPAPHDCQAILGLQKKMLMSYITEAKLLRRRAVDPKSSAMRFAYDKIVRLTIAVAELERQLKENRPDVSEFQKRVDRMKEITGQSIIHYKQQVRDYMRAGIADNDERLRQAREMLGIRMKHFYYM